MLRITKELFKIIEESGDTLPQFCDKHGLNPNTVRTWRRKKNPVHPQLRVIDEILQRIGYKLEIKRK